MERQPSGLLVQKRSSGALQRVSSQALVPGLQSQPGLARSARARARARTRAGAADGGAEFLIGPSSTARWPRWDAEKRRHAARRSRMEQRSEQGAAAAIP